MLALAAELVWDLARAGSRSDVDAVVAVAGSALGARVRLVSAEAATEQEDPGRALATALQTGQARWAPGRACVPVASRTEVLGALDLRTGDERVLDHGEQQLATVVAAGCALALERLRTGRASDARRAALDALLTQRQVALILLSGPEHLCVGASPAAEAIFHGQPLVGLSVHDAVPSLLEDGELVEFLDRVYREGTASTLTDFPVRIARPGDGLEERFFDLTLAPTRGDDRIRGVLVIGTEVTERKRAEDRRTFLAEAMLALARARDTEAIARTLADLAVPRLADWCAIDLLDEGGAVRRAAVAHPDAARRAFVLRWWEHFPPESAASEWFREVVRSGRGTGVVEISRQALAEVPDPRLAATLRELGMRRSLTVPLVIRYRVLGTLSLIMADSGRRLDDADVALAEELAHRAALALDNARLFEHEQRVIDRLARLQEVTAALSRAAEPSEVARVVVEDGTRLLRASAGGLYVVDAKSLRLSDQRGLSDGLAARYGDLDLGGGCPIAVAAREMRPVWVESAEQLRQQFPEFAASHGTLFGSLSFAALPLVARDRVLGALVYGFAEDRAFSRDERALLRTVADQCALAFERSRLFAEVAGALDRERAARAEAESANRTKDQFLATVSHELRTPLNAISGWVSMLRSGKLPPEMRERAVEVIHRNARAQEQLISDLLDVSRVISGRLRLVVDRVHVADVVAGAVEVVRPQAAAKGLELVTELEDVVVMGDADRLQQIVWNLLSNAVKFTPAGGVVKAASRRDGTHAVITVEDTGQGVRAEVLSQIFEPFRQADASFARKHGGLGLGLAISRTLAEMHGGTISAESPGEGRGATFTVRVPAAELRADATPRVPAVTATGSEPRPVLERRLEGISVLVVEDEPDSRELVMSLLEEDGARVTGAATAQEAYEKFRAHVPDVLVSDLGLPGEDGLSLVRRIRSLPEGRAVPAAALTAFVRNEDRDDALAAGYTAHVSKPIEPDLLVTTVARLARGAADERT